MSAPLLITLVSIYLSASIVMVFLPKILMVSLRKKLVDPIDPRKIHNSPASRLGGAAFYPAIYIAISLCFSLSNIFGWSDITLSNSFSLEFASLLVLYMVGLYDDLIGVAYRAKFLAQTATATFVVVSGTYLAYFYGATSIFAMPLMLAYPFTVLFVVFVTNAINLIDGINGLASMLSILALIVYGILFFYAGDYLNGAISLTTAGALAPFWYHNVFGIRKRTISRIFMGDCGALVVGFILSLMAIRLWNIGAYVAGKVPHELYYILAYTMLFIPCVDVVRVVIHRYRMKQPIFLPDKSHIHHKFMALGYSPRRSLWAIVLMQVGFMLLNILLSFKLNIIYIFFIDVTLWTLFNILITRRINGQSVKG